MLRSVKLQAAPGSNLVQRVGVLKRDPGMFSQWVECSVVVTKDKYVHVYPFKDMMAPQKLLQSSDNRDQSDQVTLDSVLGQSSDKKKTGGKVDIDWSRPFASINMLNVRGIEPKKDMKMEIL